VKDVAKVGIESQKQSCVLCSDRRAGNNIGLICYLRLTQISDRKKEKENPKQEKNNRSIQEHKLMPDRKSTNYAIVA